MKASGLAQGGNEMERGRELELRMADSTRQSRHE